VNAAEISYYGYKLYYPQDVGMGVASNLYWLGESGFEATTGRVLIELFKKNEVFLDIGSNYGFYAVLAKKVNSGIKVIAFEPNDFMVNQNEKFRKSNRVEYDLLSVGVGEENAVRDLFVPMQSGGKEITMASFNDKFSFARGMEKKAVKVKCVTLDSQLVDEFAMGVARNVCMKIDVEGYELNVLKGAGRFLKSVRPLIVCEVDFSSAPSDSLMAYLWNFGYVPFHIQPLGLTRLNEGDFNTEFGKERNFLFWPSEKLAWSGNFVPYKRLGDFLTRNAASESPFGNIP
jgi:FkbM family methyltransferase